MLELELPYIKPVFIGPNPQDRKIFMVDYDNKGYRGGTDTFTSTVKLDKNLETETVIDSFYEMLYSFDYGDYPIVFGREHNISNKKSFFELVKAGIDFLKQNAQIGPPNFIIINPKYLDIPIINKLVKDNFINENIISTTEKNIIIGRKNVNRDVEPGLYLSYDSFENFSIDAIGHRAKNQYLVLKIK